MKFCIENIPDLKKYFLGSFVKFVGVRGCRPNGEATEAGELIHTVDKINPDSISGKRFEGTEATPYTFKLYSMVQPERCPEIEMILPKKSYFNADGGCYFLSRIPARQYHRGITPENTWIQRLMFDYHDSCGLTGHLLQKYVGKQAFYSFAPREDISYAVSPRIAVSASGDVWVDTIKIGTVDYDTETICVLPLFHDEIKTILNNLGQSSWKITPPDVPKRKPRGTKSKQTEEAEF
jgi:hypothetical protein